jgi:hypothetical protein
MTPNLSQRRIFTLLTSTLTAVVAVGAARSARAQEPVADPFADQKGPPPRSGPPEPPVSSAPAASPATSANSISPGIVEELPASAYPEPVIRGLYGGPLWLDMQGLQWPYTPRTGVGISGYGWLDNMYRLLRLGGNQPSDRNTKLFQQGRFLLRVTPTYTNGNWFVQAQAEVVANKDQVNAQANGLVDADDVWVRTGIWQRWDLTVGRFQAFDVYPLGMGLDLNSDERLGAYDATNAPPVLYAADFMLYRPAGPGNAALHLYLMKFLRLELLAQYGNSGPENIVGGRPAAIFDMGWLKIRGALEYQYEFAQDPSPAAKDTKKNRGGGGSVQLVFAPYVELGANFAYAVNDEADAKSQGDEDLSSSGNKTSFGGFIDGNPIPNVLPNLLIGAGANYTTFHDLIVNPSTGAYEQSTNLQSYFAIQYLFYRQLFVKLVAGYAKSHFENMGTLVPYDDDMFSVRVRLMYLY